MVKEHFKYRIYLGRKAGLNKVLVMKIYQPMMRLESINSELAFLHQLTWLDSFKFLDIYINSTTESYVTVFEVNHESCRKFVDVPPREIAKNVTLISFAKQITLLHQNGVFLRNILPSNLLFCQQ